VDEDRDDDDDGGDDDDDDDGRREVGMEGAVEIPGLGAS
jgi:hypothetical protein